MGTMVSVVQIVWRVWCGPFFGKKTNPEKFSDDACQKRIPPQSDFQAQQPNQGWTGTSPLYVCIRITIININ
jgi:hypothetical protein